MLNTLQLFREARQPYAHLRTRVSWAGSASDPSFVAVVRAPQAPQNTASSLVTFLWHDAIGWMTGTMRVGRIGAASGQRTGHCKHRWKGAPYKRQGALASVPLTKIGEAAPRRHGWIAVWAWSKKVRAARWRASLQARAPRRADRWRRGAAAAIERRAAPPQARALSAVQRRTGPGPRPRRSSTPGERARDSSTEQPRRKTRVGTFGGALQAAVLVCLARPAGLPRLPRPPPRPPS